jgi:hypothetical protein
MAEEATYELAIMGLQDEENGTYLGIRFTKFQVEEFEGELCPVIYMRLDEAAALAEDLRDTAVDMESDDDPDGSD